MKKTLVILSITVLSALLIAPIAVRAFGWGMGGGHMMGYWGAGPGYDDGYDRDYYTLNREQQERLADLDRKFYDESRELRDGLWSKSAELDSLLSESNPDPGKVSKLQKEISDLRARLDEKAVDHEIAARKIAPDSRFRDGYGYGHMMDGYGPTYGGGYGPGGC